MSEKKYPFVSVRFSEYCQEENRSIINEYWKIEDGKFVTAPKILSDRFGISSSTLSKIVKSNSESILHVEKCLVCSVDIEITVTSLTTARSQLVNKKFICEECNSKQKEQLRKAQNPFERKSHRMNYAVKYKFWNRLEKDEFDVLRKIIEFGNYYEFRKKFLTQNFEFAWPIIEKLDNLALIDIRREGYGKGVIRELFFLPGLREALKINPLETIRIESDLNFQIPQHFNRTKESQPNFFKRVVFNQDIVLKEGTEYFCSVWENDDGSINLGITAKSELQENKSGETTNQPKHIADLIPKIWK
ncbi:hypothetical protein [Aestuariibaculum sediminum]|uniref:Uncharacterized protein n=1 Tax=Aestuariibaculum sediminum TaxID=2770637 RepID=A0A8J6UH74_9FLAO|nr:hypothetical protein [Aestuariibaculum sediminum]MBD0832516.1 hypothetical protein [Aestuariibaculum sediminum]